MARRCLHRSTLSWGFLVCLLSVTANAQNSRAWDFIAVYSADGFFEYTKDGSATLGLITSAVVDGKVKFTMCDNRTVEVIRKELRESKGKCDRRLRDPGPWQTATKELGPVFKVSDDPTNTKVIFQGQVIDLV